MTDSQIRYDGSAAGERLANDVIEAIEGRWTLQVLLCLKDGAHRFSDLKASIPRISSNVLTDRIRALEQVGLVERQYLPPPSASHVYQLTAAADGLRSALDALASWRAERAVVLPTD
jgi:DNA-binding HxlR family transcriptional regulator